MIIFILLTTLITRFLFNKCLFNIDKKVKKDKKDKKVKKTKLELPDIFYFTLLIIYSKETIPTLKKIIPDAKKINQ